MLNKGNANLNKSASTNLQVKHKCKIFCSTHSQLDLMQIKESPFNVKEESPIDHTVPGFIFTPL